MTREWLGLRRVALWRRKVLLGWWWSSCRCVTWTVSPVDSIARIRWLWGRRAIVARLLLRRRRSTAIIWRATLVPVLARHLRRLLRLLWRLLRRPSRRIVSRIHRSLVVRRWRVGTVVTVVLI